MAEQAITVIYKLAEHPDVICGEILTNLALTVFEVEKAAAVAATQPEVDDIFASPSSTSTSSLEVNKSIQKSPRRSSTGQSQAHLQSTSCDASMLSRLLSVSGHVAFRQLVLLDCDLFNELKRRREVKEQKSSSTSKKNAHQQKDKPMSATGSRRKAPRHPSDADDGAIEEELGLAGAAEEDAEAEFIRRVTETVVLSAENLLGLLRPLLVAVCVNDRKYPDPDLRASASLALAKFMMVR